VGGAKSFPRNACPELAEGRETIPQTLARALSREWIPALRQAQGRHFAGMTFVSKRIPLQMIRLHGFSFWYVIKKSQCCPKKIGAIDVSALEIDSNGRDDIFRFQFFALFLP
jgi:hypothetical protein